MTASYRGNSTALKQIKLNVSDCLPTPKEQREREKGMSCRK